MKKLLIIPDLHGRKDILDKIIKKYPSEEYYYIQLGDMIDRGKDSYGVVKTLMDLKKQKKATVIRGNHEELLIEYIDSEYEEDVDYYLDCGGKETIDSFVNELNINLNNFKDEIKKTDEYEFIKNLPSYEQIHNWVFVHAGVDLNLINWRNSSENTFTWCNYKRMLYIKNEHKEKFIMGHTITTNINSNCNYEPIISDCKTKFFLDGDAFGNGFINLMIIDGENYIFEKVD